jgi:hypothetical protein
VDRPVTTEVETALHDIDPDDAIHPGLFDVARPRGPPAQTRDEHLLARTVKTNGPGRSFVPHPGKIPTKTRVDSDSSESRHPSTWRSSPTVSTGSETRDFNCQQRSHPATSRGSVGADAHQHGGTHE